MQRAAVLLRERPALVGAAWLFVAVNIANGLAYVYQVAMLRLLPPREFALLVSLFAALIIEAQGISLVQNAAAKIVADRRALGEEDAIAAFAWLWGRRIALVVLVPALAIVAAAVLLASDVGFPPITLAMLGASLLFAALFAFAAGLLQGLGRFGWLGAVAISQAGARLVLGVVFVLAGLGLAGAFGAAAAAIGLSLLAALVALRDVLARRAAASAAPPFGRFFLGAAVVLFCYAALVNVDALLAPALLARSEAGAYAAAVTMGKIALFAPLGLSLFLLERTASAHALGAPTLPMLGRVLGAVAIVSGAVALVYLLVPGLATRVVAGEEYVERLTVLVPIYGLVAFSNALLNVWIAHFVGIGRLRVGAIFAAAAAALLAVLLIGVPDAVGMASRVLAVSLATQAVVVLYFLARR